MPTRPTKPDTINASVAGSGTGLTLLIAASEVWASNVGALLACSVKASAWLSVDVVVRADAWFASSTATKNPESEVGSDWAGAASGKVSVKLIDEPNVMS